ncbi:MAG: hypothetical protein EHM93_08930 [Bacteroidales bacterium]|nr:MAG: hypothetical protein EHM93_08930 [Bacteroidales bacterium]
MKTKRILSVFIIAVLVCGYLPRCKTLSKQSECINNSGAPVILYSKLFNDKSNWKVIKKDSLANSGHIKIKDEIWLMHFLHWWSLDEKNSDISIEYTKKLLENLWGMQYSLNGIEGETKINGHQAYYVEGVLRNFVKTRFIVWNCPESKRQFLSDCNINIALKTPDEFLNLQTTDITNSVCCHNSNNKPDNTKLEQRINYEDMNISINLPENWRSEYYIVNPNSIKNRPGYYQNGITKQRGAVWNLLTDSKKEINLIWQKSNNRLSEKYMNIALNKLFNDTLTIMNDTLKYISFYTNISSQNITFKNDFIESTGNFDIVVKLVGRAPVDTSHYLYKAFLWKYEETEYLLVATMVAYNNIWDISFDLAPTENQFNGFINDVVLKSICNHPMK